ncbi:WLM domain-containing protein [Dissophora ornata]|nr:WLM domain-containing protein [Dissophora ornata]
MASGSDLIKNITCLTSKTNHEEALKLLKKVATMVRPIMKAHGWKTHILAEFYPKGVLGMNTNHGWKIQLCLRRHSDENTFLPWHDIIGTMLHELAHNIRGPHDAQFYKALDGLNDEYDKIEASGYTGGGFDAMGHQLGTKHGGFGPGGIRLGATGATTVTGVTKAAAVAAAEKRRQMNEIMMPAGGRRLGGATAGSSSSKTNSTSKAFWEQWHSPGELAAMAAERRAQDQVWCGSSTGNEEEVTPSAAIKPLHLQEELSESSRDVSSSAVTPPGIKRKNDFDQPLLEPTDEVPKKSKSDRPVIDLTSSASSSSTITDTCWSEWSCPACTLMNRPRVLQCECCLTQRPRS